MAERIIKNRIVIWISSFIVFVLVVVILALLFVHTDFFADRVADVLGSYCFHRTDYKLEIGKIDGNLLGRLYIRNLIIRYRGDDFSYDVVRIEEINCRYDLISLLGKRHRMDELSILRPHIWIKQGPSEINKMPGGIESFGKLFRFTVAELNVSKGQIIYQGANSAEAVKNIKFEGSVTTRENGVYVQMRKGSCNLITRKISINEIKGNVIWKNDKDKNSDVSNILLENYSVRTESSKLILNGRFNPFSMNIDMRVKCAPLDLKEAGYIFDFAAEATGRVNGVFDIRGENDILNLKGVADGIISGFALNDFNMDITVKDSIVRMNHFEGGINGAYVVGDGAYLIEDEKLLKISLSTENIDLSKGFYPGTRLPETDFTGKIGVKYYPCKNEVLFQFDLEKGHFRRFPYEHAVISGVHRGDSLLLEKAWMKSSTHTVDIYGSITGKDKINLFVDIKCEAVDTLFPYFNIEEYRTDIDVNGLWSGSFDSWDLRVSGSCNNFEYRNVFVPDGQIKLAMKRDKYYSLFLDLSGDSCCIDPFGFSGIELSLDYFRGKTNIKRLNLERPGFKAKMRGEVIKNGDITRFVFSDVVLEMLEENWKSSGNFNVVISDSTLFFDDMQFHSKLGALYFVGTLNKFENTLDSEFRFDRLDMSLLNNSGLISVPLKGKTMGTLSCTGDIADPSMEIDLELTEGVIDTITVKSLAVKASYADGYCVVDSVSLSTTAGFGFASGTMSGVSWKEINKDGIKALRNAVVDLGIYSARLAMKPFAEYFGDTPFSDGMFTGRLVLTDSLVHPEIDFDGTMNDLVLNHISIPRIDLHASTSGDQIKFDGSIFMFPSGKGKLSGFLPVKEKEWFYSLDREKPFHFNLEVPDCDLESVERMSDLVAEGDGRGSLRFNIQGSMNDPDLSGRIDLFNASFRPAGMEEKFRDVNSYISIEDTLIKIHSLEGKEGKDGKFNCSGSIVIRDWKPANYDLSIDLNKVLIAGIRDVLAIVSGKISIDAERVDGKVIPSLSGDLEVNKVELYYDFGEMGSRENGTSMSNPSWIAEVNLDMGGEARIRTPDANIELLGKVVLYHNRKGTYLRGRLKLHRGWYNIYNNKFRVNSGTLVFALAGKSRPIVDIEAETFDPEGKRIYLTIMWDENDPQPRLLLRHEESGYSETDIWKMLGGGIIGSPDGDKGGWDALGTAQNLATNYFENVLNSQMEGFTVSLEQSSQTRNSGSGSIAGEKETMLAVGKYLSQGLYVKYKQGLSVFNERDFEIEYRISDLFLIRSEYKHSDRVFLGENRKNSDEINFDVKMRWEF